MSYASTVPAAIAALLATFRAAPGLAGTEVRDGPQTPDSSALEAVYVGSTGDPAGDAWTSEETPTAGLGGPHREMYVIHCSAMVLNEDGDVAAARARAFQLRDAAGGQLAAGPKLAGTVMRASLTSGAGQQVATANGVKVHVLFDVEVDAFTTR